MNNKFKTAFTLVELLVVIAIVGILSGLIIVGMNNSVQQATIAKAQVFSASLRDSLLADLVSEWKMDGNANDSWGTNNCTWNGASGGSNTSANWRPVSECMYGQCLNFDGTDDYLDCGNSASVNIPGALTVEAWFKASSLPGSGFAANIIRKGTTGGGSFQNYMFYFDNNVMRFYIGDGTNNNLASTPALSANVFYHIVGTYIPSTSVSIYLNGVKYSSATTISSLYQSATNLLIGTSWNKYFAGVIDNVRLYNDSIPTSQVIEQYYAGLIRLYSRGDIGDEEYQQRLSEVISNIAIK